MEQFTIDPPKDPVNGYYITNAVTVEFEFVGRSIRMRYTFRDERPLEVIGTRMDTASENMLAKLVDFYISSVEDHSVDDRNRVKIISELEGFIEHHP